MISGLPYLLETRIGVNQNSNLVKILDSSLTASPSPTRIGFSHEVTEIPREIPSAQSAAT